MAWRARYWGGVISLIYGTICVLLSFNVVPYFQLKKPFLISSRFLNNTGKFSVPLMEILFPPRSSHTPPPFVYVHGRMWTVISHITTALIGQYSSEFVFYMWIPAPGLRSLRIAKKQFYSRNTRYNKYTVKWFYCKLTVIGLPWIAFLEYFPTVARFEISWGISGLQCISQWGWR